MSTDVVAKYESAVNAREAIEEEIAAYVAELTSGTNPGVSGPLVDAEGFPRADVDVYRVRQARHLLARKQTDHKHVMKTIEELLPQYVDCCKMLDGIKIYNTHWFSLYMCATTECLQLAVATRR